ncbi:hypothetical protein ACFX2I_000329 [Malus domestica]
MLAAGLQLDEFTYKALVNGFCKVLEMDSAKDILFAMLDVGIYASYCPYTWIIDGYCNQENEAVIRVPDEKVLETVIDLWHRKVYGFLEKLRDSDKCL